MFSFSRALRASLASCGYRQATVMAKKKQFYAVVKGRRPGIYRTWEECSSQVKNFPNNLFKAFPTELEAVQFMTSHGLAAAMAAIAAAPEVPARLQAPLQLRPAERPIVAQQQQRVGGPSASGGAAADHLVPAKLSPLGRTLRLEFDGASKRNPGPAGFGAVLYDDATNIEVTRLCQYMGAHHTNNQAEYAGLIAGLQAALDLGCEHIQVRGDSTLIIKQVLGQYQVKNEGLKPYHTAAVQLSRRFKSFHAHQVPREQNKVADALSNEAITNYVSGRNPHIWTLAASTKRKAAAETEEGWEVGEDWDGGGSGSTAADVPDAAQAGLAADGAASSNAAAAGAAVSHSSLAAAVGKKRRKKSAGGE